MKNKNPDFISLWRLCIKEFEKLNLPRQKAVFLNHEHKKEEICRRFNIVTVEDISRLSKYIENN